MTAMLAALLAGIREIGPGADRPISALSLDSRTVVPGALFMALAGTSQDGRRFISDAVARGAAAVVCENGADAWLGAVPVMACAGLRRQVGVMADRFYGHPSQALSVIGVTGTNGKTTTSHLIAHALNTRSPCALIGTLGNGFPGALVPADRTTPDAISVHRWLDRFRREGASAASLEVSSHALDQGRVVGVRFAGAVFTNLTRDHLDYHGDMARYGEAKALLFAVPDIAFAVLNSDDPFSEVLAGRLSPGVRVWRYGGTGDVRIEDARATPRGLEIALAVPEGPVTLKSPLFGSFNVYNLAAALTTLLALGWQARDAASALATVTPIPGRMEPVPGRADQPFVVVDYAHTPDALEKALAGARVHAAKRVICVFGCGGDRDRGKRSLMGACASRYADLAIVTHDNPRHEDPDRIIADILSGVPDEARARFVVMGDRQAAIAHALREGSAGDVVVIAGKGHEEYQQFGDRRVPYSDRLTARQLLGAP
ncbi:UDP-N-acetylmuramoyl-L-alanyl-D-glutamate--2,6-diaminopimelate ligase [Acidiferrobacter sp.]|uniref:UDP-N-acetylmuramoyl-L-alanyl-D-glutamate--2, 6-diaminopimelate ligase n=1 Tax=Acidiferrobacter sp. TaxID=1872107 RepID=UPI00261142C3|nr:UDP-N-acetylmuramoyl-L-alanyl-D-glutamate--2,6-diaminopimelate ligase [Acidiferrobacter sp.]